jgi:hypothetical protein
MVSIAAEPMLQTMEIVKAHEIAAPLDIVFETLLEQLGPDFETVGPLPMILEAWPGGRWYRDLGDGAGHYWGHVQVIKPPTLLEICGPLCMSTPAVSHIQYRLTKIAEGTLLSFVHRAIGQIPTEHREGMVGGWHKTQERIRKSAEQKMAKR